MSEILLNNDNHHLILYVLELIGGKYYVGITQCLRERLKSHFGGQGSSWTKCYKPIKLVEIVAPASKITERIYTLSYMEKYGWENVRGAGWTAVQLMYPPRAFKTFKTTVNTDLKNDESSE